MQFPLENPRQHSRQLVQNSVDPKTWERNTGFTHGLVDKIVKHRLCNHPVLGALDRKEFTLESARMMHLEFRVAFAQIFTDGLIRLMETTNQLEPALGAKAKVAARFLIQMNVLEELGYRPNSAGTEEFCGHPGFSHYLLFTDTLAALGASEDTWKSYVASKESWAARETLEGNYDNHLRLAVVLALCETAFVYYAGPWAKNTIHVCKTDIAGGYHSIHVEDADGTSIDDDHSEDSWYIVRQALTPERYGEIDSMLTEVLDIWSDFGDMWLRKHQAMKLAA